MTCCLSLKSRCTGLEITSYAKYHPDEKFKKRLSQTIYQYKTYKKMFDITDKGRVDVVQILRLRFMLLFLLDYLFDLNLKYVRIYFDTTSYMKITKYKATTFEDKLSAIGGTIGLLTGCSIISWVEIIFFGIKFIFNWVIKI